MLVKGWILRLDIDIGRNLLILTVKTESGGYKEIEIRYRPKLYITGPHEEIQNIVKANDGYILDFEVEKWFLPPWYDIEKNVYVLTVAGPWEYYRLIDMFRRDGRWVLWNLTPTLGQRFLWENGISVSTYLEIKIGEGVKARVLEDLEEINYRDPPFKRLAIRLMDWYGDVLNPWLKPPKWYEVYYGSSVLRFRDTWELQDFIERVDPDVVEYIGRHTFTWLMKRRGLRQVLRRRRRVYINYHDNVFDFRDYHGLVELSRLSRIDLHRISRYSIGKILTAMEAIEAFKMQRAIPEARVDAENPKTIDMLRTADRGGLYLIPRQGLYWNVAQCDFSSFYPTIIYKYNIGNETVNRPKCTEYIEAPSVQHRICQDIRGVVPNTIEKLVMRRLRYKDLYRESGDEIVYSRQNAIKWILVACFGYLGYRNARFGKIEAYECVTAYARDILAKVIRYVAGKGFRVIHALVDSIWIHKDKATMEDYQRLCREVTDEFGIKMDLDMHYKWIYFPMGRSRAPAPAMNRYYGVGYDESIKIKGIEAVRRDSPEIIKKFQLESIYMLRKTRDISEFREVLANEVNSLFKIYLERIKSRDVDVRELTITKKIHRKPTEYLGNPIHIRLAIRYGFREGDMVRYIVLEGGDAIPIEVWREGYRYDIEYYIGRLYEAFKSLPVEYLKGINVENNLIGLDRWI